jgi:hypothetical protein
MKIIIGITGKLGSGKDYIANNVVIPVLEKYASANKDIGRFMQCAFADQIKVNVMTKNNISYTDVYENKTSVSRQLLQKEGTDIGRKKDKDIWIRYIDNWMKVYYHRGINIFVLTDVRFKNEYEFVKFNQDAISIIIKIVADKRNNERLITESGGSIALYEKISEHPSECDLDDLRDDQFDLIIKNDVDDNFNLDTVKLQFSKVLYEAQINASSSILI